jgi:hypothetical protein
MKYHQSTALITVIFATLSFSSLAGTKLVMQSAEAEGQFSDSNMLIQGDMLRMTHFDKSSSSESDIIFNHNAQSLLIIDPQEQSYTQFEAAQLASVKAKMDQIKQKMETQLAKMPAEQQKMMREMMAGKMGLGAAKPKPEKKIIKMGKSGSAGGYDCEFVEVHSDGVKKRELCVTEWSKLKNGSQIKSAMQGMMSFFETIMDSMGQFAGQQQTPFSDISELGGFPIIYKEFKNGILTGQSKLKSIEDSPINDANFSPPKGYKKQSLNDLM